MGRKSRLFSASAASMAAILAVLNPWTQTRAESGQIYIVFAKAGRVFSSYGSGSLFAFDRRRRLTVEGINFDALPQQRVRIDGRVSNLKDGSNIAGIYRAVAGGSSVLNASATARLENKDGVVLELHLIKQDQGAALDLAGMTITPH